MIAVLLPALNIRGNRSPYLWWFHKLQHAMGDQAGYICGDEYYREPSQLLAEGRQEASPGLASHYRYRLPDGPTLAKLVRADIPPPVWQAIESRYPANPLAAFRHYCLEEDAGLYEAMANALDRLAALGGPLEAVVTCVNCATLKSLCRNRNLPLVHVELGPLRQPAFLQTAYFDFSGVNGETEAKNRYVATDQPHPANPEQDMIGQLRHLFLLRPLPSNNQPQAELGLCLQVEDDSNIVCYARDHSSLSLINDAQLLLAERHIAPPVLVRSHPVSYFSLRRLPAGLVPDDSASSLAFALRCKRIHTINSGLAAEALLLGRNAIVRGDSPFAYCADTETGQGDPNALAFFLLNYLVPWQIAFSPEYLRWRLGKPSEREIRQYHLDEFMQDKIKQLEQQVSELERQLEEIRSSFAWRLSYPLRALIRHVRRLLRR